MVEQLSSDLRRSVRGGAWHGPSLFEALEGVTAAQAAARPIAGAHSIWELVLHVTAWMDEVRCRISGDYHHEPLAGDFPAVAATTDAAWSAARAELERALNDLLAALKHFPAERLNEKVAAQSGSLTIGAMLRGLAQHNAYHAGQIRLLAKGSRVNTIGLDENDVHDNQAEELEEI